MFFDTKIQSRKIFLKRLQRHRADLLELRQLGDVERKFAYFTKELQRQFSANARLYCKCQSERFETDWQIAVIDKLFVTRCSLTWTSESEQSAPMLDSLYVLPSGRCGFANGEVQSGHHIRPLTGAFVWSNCLDALAYGR